MDTASKAAGGGKGCETVRGTVTAASDLAAWVGEREGRGKGEERGCRVVVVAAAVTLGGGCTIFLDQNEPNVTVTAQHSSEGTAGQGGK